MDAGGSARHWIRTSDSRRVRMPSHPTLSNVKTFPNSNLYRALRVAGDFFGRNPFLPNGLLSDTRARPRDIPKRFTTGEG
jgi:hypothetical protein